MAWEAHGKTCLQNRWKLKPRISKWAKETKQKVENVTINFQEKNLRNELSKEDLKRENNKISVMKLSQEEHKNK